MDEKAMLTESAKVAIVDDDQPMREAIRTLLESMDMSVEEFASAESLLDSRRSPAFDCLILDVRMSGLSGLELQRQLVSDNCPTPIVFITARASEAVRASALELGAIAFLSKPFSEDDLLSAIRSSLAVREASGGGPAEESN
jgi:FixJ family two-component response regulator